MSDKKTETPILFFFAEIAGVKNSLINRYFELTRFLTPLVLLLILIPPVLLWGKISAIWILVVTLLIPMHFWLIHLFVAHRLYIKSLQDDKIARIYITNQFISIETLNGNNQYFAYADIFHLKLILGGAKKPQWFFGFQDNPCINEISFKYHQQTQRIFFFIFSKDQLQHLQNALSFWEKNDIPFQEYKDAEGIPLKSAHFIKPEE